MRGFFFFLIHSNGRLTRSGTLTNWLLEGEGTLCVCVCVCVRKAAIRDNGAPYSLPKGALLDPHLSIKILGSKEFTLVIDRKVLK